MASCGPVLISVLQWSHQKFSARRACLNPQTLRVAFASTAPAMMWKGAVVTFQSWEKKRLRTWSKMRSSNDQMVSTWFNMDIAQIGPDDSFTASQKPGELDSRRWLSANQSSIPMKCPKESQFQNRFQKFTNPVFSATVQRLVQPPFFWLAVTGTWLFFPFSWECHHPNWRTPSFFRGYIGQPPTSSACFHFLTGA